MISLSLGFVIFIFVLSIVILLAMKLIFVTKKELDEKLINSERKILESLNKEMSQFYIEFQNFINRSLKDKIDVIDNKIDKILMENQNTRT